MEGVPTFAPLLVFPVEERVVPVIVELLMK